MKLCHLHEERSLSGPGCDARAHAGAGFHLKRPEPNRQGNKWQHQTAVGFHEFNIRRLENKCVDALLHNTLTITPRSGVRRG